MNGLEKAHKNGLQHCTRKERIHARQAKLTKAADSYRSEKLHRQETVAAGVL